MAKCSVGPFGHPSGKIGNVVFYMLNGQPVCRLIGRAGKPSINQLANRQAMTVTMALTKPMANFINVSFKLEAEGTVKNQHNLATSYNKKQALTGEYPNIKVDYAKVVLSHGSLKMVEDLKMTKGEEGINLTWNSDRPMYSGADDIVMVVLSHPTKGLATSFLNAAKRSDGSCFLPLYEEWMMNQQMEVYVCIKSANEKSISDSAYVGNLNGTPESEETITEKARYNVVKTRFDQIAAVYEQKQLDSGEDTISSKAFRQMEKEYHVLKEKLKHMPGKPS